jgi:hypothetical protein
MINNIIEEWKIYRSKGAINGEAPDYEEQE